MAWTALENREPTVFISITFCFCVKGQGEIGVVRGLGFDNLGLDFKIEFGE